MLISKTLSITSQHDAAIRESRCMSIDSVKILKMRNLVFENM